ncbi:MAG: hypothetical protein ACREJQ_08120 [bacterium]
MSSIQIAIERYATDSNGLFPHTIDELLTRKLMDRWPRNPYTGRQMKQVPWRQHSPGDFFYWVDKNRFGYCLGAYASDSGSGSGGHGVAVYYSGGIDPSMISSAGFPEICKP